MPLLKVILLSGGKIYCLTSLRTQLLSLFVFKMLQISCGGKSASYCNYHSHPLILCDTLQTLVEVNSVGNFSICALFHVLVQLSLVGLNCGRLDGAAIER